MRTPEPSTTPTVTLEDLLKKATKSVLDKEKRTTRSLKKTRKDDLLLTASSSSLRSLAQDRHPSACPVISSLPLHYNSNSKSFLPPLAAEDRNRDGEKALEREKFKG